VGNSLTHWSLLPTFFLSFFFSRYYMCVESEESFTGFFYRKLLYFIVRSKKVYAGERMVGTEYVYSFSPSYLIKYA